MADDKVIGLVRNNYKGFSSEIKALERTIRANGYYKPSQSELFRKFQRVANLDPSRRLNYTKEYLFFTKPDLQIYKGDSGILQDKLRNVPLFAYAHKYYPHILKQLQYSSDSGQLPFMNFLSNMKRSNLELPSISTSSDIETATNIHGTKTTYRGTSYSADDGYEFNLEFEDTKYLELYMLFKIYDEYENRKHYGIIDVPQDYVINKILHDQFSVYKFILDEDFQTIVYWAKLTGVYPKSVPRETFSDLPDTGGLTYNISFKATFVEDMKPELLEDFNAVASLVNPRGSTISLWDGDIAMTNPEWCSTPIVIFNSDNDSSPLITRPKLKWR